MNYYLKPRVWIAITLSLSLPLLPSPPPSLSFRRSIHAHKNKTKEKLHMSTELLDLDEALTFLEEVVHHPEKVTVKGSLPPLQKWKGSPAPSPEPPHRVERVGI